MIRSMTKWFVENCLITLIMMLFAAVIAGLYQQREISGQDYQVLVEAWPNLKAPLKAQITEAIASGNISRWDYTDLRNETKHQIGVISWEKGIDRDKEREKLLNLVKRD